MKLLRENRIFVIILAVAVVASAVVCFQRMGVENDAKTVDFIIDYKEATLLAEQSKHDVSWWLKEFKKLGVEQAGLAEESLITLTESDLPVEAKMLEDIKKDVDWKEEYPAEFVSIIEEKSKDDFDVIVETRSEDMSNFVARAFTERFDSDRTTIYQETPDHTFFLIDGSVEDSLFKETYKYIDTEGEGFTQINEMESSKIMYLNLGMLPEKIETIQNAGMTVIPRTVEYEGWNDTRFAQDVVEGYEAVGGAPKYWILAGTVVPGYDDGTEFITDYLNENGTTIGIVEDTTQRQNLDPDGLEDIIKGTDYNTVRVFSVWGYIQNRYNYYGYEGPEEIDNSLFRAVVERNIKVVYYKPMKMKDDSHRYITDINEYKKSFDSLHVRFAEHGITFGTASVENPFFVSIIAKILIAIGAGTAALILLSAIFRIREKYKWILFGLGCAGVLGAYFVAPNMAGLLTSFAASVIMPCLAAIYMMQQASEERVALGPDAKTGKLILTGFKILIAGVVISLFGAFMTAAPISSIDYMLELDIFRGVKVSQLLPLAFYALIYLMFFGYLWGEKKDSRLIWPDVRNLFMGRIQIWVVFVAAIMGAAGYIYLARTGHETNVSATTVELLVRNFLEEILYARPRTKEFLVAFPAVMLFVYCLVKNLKVLSFVFGTAAVIGFTSIVNTFMHIRTPLELGLVRTGYSVLFGVILGIIYVLILDLILRLYRKWGNKANA